MFSKEPDIKFEDRLSDIKLNDMLHHLCDLNKLPLLSLKIKHRVNPLPLQEPESCWTPSFRFKSNFLTPAIELTETKAIAPEKEIDDEYCLVDPLPRKKRESLTITEVDMQDNSNNTEEKFSEDKVESFTVNYFIYENEYVDAAKSKQKKKFVVFLASRDQDKEKYAYLALASDIIKTYTEKFPLDNSTLLLPIVQCGMYMKLENLPFKNVSVGTVKLYDSLWAEREHFVLAAVNLNDKKIIIHDSQGYVNSLLYWQTLTSPGFETIYNNLNQQTGHNLCGYYTHCYINAYLKMGDDKQLAAIKIAPNLIKTREHYLKHWEKILNHLVENRPLLLEDPIKESCARPRVT